MKRISKATLFVFALFIFVATTGHFEIEAADRAEPFLVLADTTSPDGHYALCSNAEREENIRTAPIIRVSSRLPIKASS